MAITEHNDQDLKRAFAEAWLRNPEQPYKAAFEVMPQDTGKALQMATQWIRDPEIVKLKLEIIDEVGFKSFLPSKEDQAKDIWKMATDQRLEPEDRLKAHRLYAEVMGHIEKDKGTQVNVLNQAVMVVKEHGSDDEWEARTIAQQAKLISDAKVNVIDAN